jgi:hypothetical protein
MQAARRLLTRRATQQHHQNPNEEDSMPDVTSSTLTDDANNTTPLVAGLGRCTGCGWHTTKQGHHPECPGPAPEPEPPDLEDIAARAEVARRAALPYPTRKRQIDAYSTTGPTPPLSCTGDFIGNIKQTAAAIGLILQGCPIGLFDWSDPATPKSLRDNNPARVRARWEAIKPPIPKPKRRTKDEPVLGATEKGMAALRDESVILENATTRNIQLNTSAFKLGQLVASGDLPEALVTAELRAVALSIGLTEAELRRTELPERAVHDGIAKPRTTR